MISALRVASRYIQGASKEEALKTILNTPNWEEKVKEWFKNKEAGLSKLAPFALALGLLMQSTGAQTAPDLISDIKEMVPAEKSIDTVSLIDSVSKMLPYPVTEDELRKLQIKVGPFSVPFIAFKISLEKKIEKGLKDIADDIKKDPKLSSLGTEELTNIIAKALIKKIQDPRYSKGHKIVVEYLKKDGLKRIEDIAKNTLEKTLPIVLRA